MNNTWTPSSWRDKPIRQVPTYEDAAALAEVERMLADLPPLVFAGEARKLKKELAKVVHGEAFLLQGGDCAETFIDFKTNSIRDLLKVLLQMAVVLTYGASKPIVKVGRVAGQFAKPRSAPEETQGDVTLPIFRGDIINGIEFTKESRTPDPTRMLRAYQQSVMTMNLLRALTSGGYADLRLIHTWNTSFVDRHKQEGLMKIEKRIQKALDFMKACGIADHASLQQTDFFTSHEGLLLPYEQALTRRDSITDDYYACSAHMLWIGERTRALDEAHVEFMRGINNPIGVKISDAIDPDTLCKLCDRLNPNNESGRLVLISRMGAANVGNGLPKLVKTVKDAGYNVVWSCDPMHGNTVKASNGYKTRKLDDILSEVKTFFDVHEAEGTIPGGVHIEMTGSDVTECLGGLQNIAEIDLASQYRTQCDPRLNAEQATELAFLLADEFKK